MAGDQRLLKRINRMAIVRHVKAHPGLARGALAELTGLADSTVSVLVNELIEEGWLRATDSSAGGVVGRRPKLLALDPDRIAILGAEMGVDYLNVVACSLRGEVLFSRMIDYQHGEVGTSVHDLAARIVEARSAMLARRRRLLGVGVGVPGMVTSDGLLRFAPASWASRSLAASTRVSSRLKGPPRMNSSGLMVTMRLCMRNPRSAPASLVPRVNASSRLASRSTSSPMCRMGSSCPVASRLTAFCESSVSAQPRRPQAQSRPPGCTMVWPTSPARPS